MYKIESEFERIDHITLYDMIGSIGVYVIWDARSTKKPRYIGQGYLLDRLSKHNDIFYPPLNGYVSIVGYDGKDSNKYKHQAELLEAALLWVADETSRISKSNKQQARTGLMDNLFEKHGVIRYKLTGYDPFRHPKSAGFIGEDKTIISVRPRGKYEIDIEHKWRWLRGA
jgi:hypothetical protein